MHLYGACDFKEKMVSKRRVFLISPLTVLPLALRYPVFAILPKDTAGEDLRLSGQRLRDRLLAVDPHRAVVLFVHDGLNGTIAGAVQLKTLRSGVAE